MRVAGTRMIGGYALFDVFASGGMANIHLGRRIGHGGFGRTVAIKRMFEHLATDAKFVAMFLDEARVAARIRHPNVVPTLDVIAEQGELLIVMEYVQGASLASVMKALRATRGRVPPPIASAIVSDVLEGLHAAHEVRGSNHEPLALVHRDVSPQNVLLGADGLARVIDFGVAKANDRMHQSMEGELKGKLAYMPPEQLAGGQVTRRSDVYATGVVLWECLTGRQLRGGGNDVAMEQLLLHDADPPSRFAKGLPRGADDVVMRAMAARPEDRFATAHDMAIELGRVIPRASTADVASWLRGTVGTALAEQTTLLARVDAFEASESSTPEVQVGSVSPAVLSTRPARPARPAWRATIAVVAACAVCLAALVTWRAHRARTSSGPSLTSTAVAVADSSAAPASAPTPPPIAAISTAAPPLVSPTDLPLVPPPRPRARPAPPSAATTRDPCRVPFTLDESGNRHYKRECLKP